MKKIAVFLVTAASLAATSAMAQGVSIGVGPNGPGVTVDDGYRGDGYRSDRDRDFRRSYNEYRDDRRYRRDWDRDRRSGDRVYIERD